jgi:tyrosine-protein kinase Etk/Wzc
MLQSLQSLGHNANMRRESKSMETISTDNSERTLWQGIAHFVSIFWKFRLLIIITTSFTTLCVVAFCVVSIILPPGKSPLPNIYSAEATILVQGGGQSDIAGSILSALGVEQSAGSSSRDNGDIILEILHSRMLLDRLVNEYSLAERYQISKNVKGNARLAVLSNADFSYERSSGTLRIAYQDIDPVFAKNIANRMVGLLDEWFSMNRGLAKQKQRQILEEKIAEVKNTIASLQSRIKRLQTQYGVLDVQGLSQSQATAIAGLRSQLILKEIDIMNYSSFSKIDDPRLEQLKEERQNLLDLIAQNQLKLPDSQQGGDAAAVSGPDGSKNLLDVAQAFSQLTIELDIQQRIYNTLSPQYEAMKLAPESEAAFQVLELADVPDIKSGPKRARFVMMAFFGSLAASLAASLGLNVIREHVRLSQPQASGIKDVKVL